jgi:hypothetical protein
MARFRVGHGLLAAGLALLWALPGYAQGIGTPYGLPNSPAMSPWLNLYQRQGGPLDPYHMFVQPQMQLRDTLQQQQANLQRQTAGLSALGQTVTQISPTGVGAGFMNHGRYFFNQPSAGVHAPGAGHGAPAGRHAWTPPPAQTGGMGAGMGAGTRGF